MPVSRPLRPFQFPPVCLYNMKNVLTAVFRWMGRPDFDFDFDFPSAFFGKSNAVSFKQRAILELLITF